MLYPIKADDVFEGILYHIGKDKEIPAGQELHKKFYQLQKDLGFHLLDHFSFDLDRPFPYCEDLTFAVGCLQSGNLLSISHNGKYTILPGLEKHFEKVTGKNFPPHFLEQLATISEKF